VSLCSRGEVSLFSLLSSSEKKWAGGEALVSWRWAPGRDTDGGSGSWPSSLRVKKCVPPLLSVPAA